MSVGGPRPIAPRSVRTEQTSRRAARPEPPPAAEREAFERCYACRSEEQARDAERGARGAPADSAPPTTPELALRWMLAKQQLAEDIAAPTAPPALDRELFELIARNVDSVLRPAGAGPQRIALRLDPRVFGDTELWIEQIDGGWRLDVGSDDAALLEALSASSGRLIERFAAAGLGALELRFPPADDRAGVGPR